MHTSKLEQKPLKVIHAATANRSLTNKIKSTPAEGTFLINGVGKIVSSNAEVQNKNPTLDWIQK